MESIPEGGGDPNNVEGMDGSDLQDSGVVGVENEVEPFNVYMQEAWHLTRMIVLPKFDEISGYKKV